MARHCEHCGFPTDRSSFMHSWWCRNHPSVMQDIDDEGCGAVFAALHYEMES